MGVVIITDSGSDYTPAQAQRVGIDLVPITLLYDGQRLRDGIDIERDTFYTRVREQSELPATEPPSVAEYDAAFARRVNTGSDVVYISLSGKLSKAYEHGAAAAQRFQDRVAVVDSRGAGGLMVLLCEFAVELAAKGASAAQIAQALDPQRLKRAAFFSMPDIAPLGRSGRLPKPLVALGSMLNVSLVLRMDEDGAVGPAGQSRSFERTCDIMVDSLVRALDRSPSARIAISHADAPDVANALKAQIESKFGERRTPIGVYQAAPTIVSHMGRGAVGVFGIVP